MLRVLLALLLVAAPALAVESEMICRCGAAHLLPKPMTFKPGRKYARDRFVDVQHLKLDVTPDFAKRTIGGTATLVFKPIARPLMKLELDAMGLTIEDVSAQGATLAGHEVTDEKLVITFTNPIAADAEATVRIRYQTQPEHGLYFRTPEMGYKPGDTQLWTQGEAELHRYWFPCYDYPNERFSSEVFCHVPEGMSVISNGKLLSQEKGANGLHAWHWLQTQPHVNYLVALAAGYFHKIEDKVGALPIAMHVPPSEKEQAANAFRDTKAILEFFNREIGVPFPWDKYHQVYCLDFIAGGMENTSCTFEAAGMLFRDDTEQLTTLHRLDAHETAHQWFGDLVTCRDWSHLWLNEGFASYYTVLYEEQKSGRDAMLYSLWREAQRVLEKLSDTRPTVWRDYRDPMEQFDQRVYPKGAWILHMMRSRLGPDLYRECIRTYLERHRNGIATTDDLLDAMEEKSGLSFDQFADQWLYHGGVPELNVAYSWDAATKLAKLTIKQTQKVSTEVLLFRLDLPVRFLMKGNGAASDFKIALTKAEEDFYFPLPEAPELVRIDPDYTVLTKVDFTPPADMLKRQLTGDLIGRMLAAQLLEKKKDAASVKQLAGLLQDDPFHGVRSEAAKSLKKIATPEARAALAQSLAQPDARVRADVVEALAAFPHDEVHEALWKQAQVEKNPRILAAIIKTWSARPGNPQVSDALRKQLATTSYRNTPAAAAIATLRAQDDNSAVPAILKRLSEAPLEFETYDFADALNDVAFLARDEKHPQRNEVFAFLTTQLNSPKEPVRVASAKALGTLRDPRGLALLEPLTQVRKPFADPVRDAAEKSVTALQAQLAGPVEMKNLWDRLQELQKKTEEMQKEMDKVKAKATPVTPVKPLAPAGAEPVKAAGQ
jgi:aminopeptidase N